MIYSLKRHKLLKILSKQRNIFSLTKTGVIAVEKVIILDKLKCSEIELKNILSELFINKEVKYYNNGFIGYYSTVDGVSSFTKNKYINEFFKFLKNIFLNISQILVPILSLIITIIVITKENKKDKKELDKIKTTLEVIINEQNKMELQLIKHTNQLSENDSLKLNKRN
jgi:hypothetical protein